MNPWPDTEWNPLLGCSPVSDECDRCYSAVKLSKLVPDTECLKWVGDKPYFNSVVRWSPSKMTQPLADRRPGVVFVCPDSDLFHEHVAPELHDRIWHVFEMMQHKQFNILTKRAARMQQYLTTRLERRGLPLPNVRVGISAGRQCYLDDRWPFLRDTPACARHVSLQPLLEAITLPDDMTADNCSWVAIMRELGKGARPMLVRWVRSLRDQCESRGIPFFWETTRTDSPECETERRRAARDGRPYRVQPRHLQAWVVS